ncbi:MAG: putative carnitine dehydratase/acyl-CoA transferase-related [Alphaproteobacteria bacterium]|nr:putative carnitine dehydratase/acyl-CoA transferase-related [Alphaproteobacteria bacterium]
MGALDGITIVSIEQAVAAPLCTARLAEAGARVIKIERAEGDFARGYDSVVSGDSAFFVWLNRGKESIVLDIKRPEDAALLERMIARADIFVQNLAPGAAARSGFGSEALRARHPRLITCDISGYGEDGPYRDMRAYDLLIQCESGFASVTGSPEAPGRAGVSIADISCGTTAYAGLVQALYERERTGVARGLSVSLFDTLAEWMSVPLLHAEHGAGAPLRTGLRHPMLAPYGLYSTGEGEGVVFAVQNEREWARFCEQVLDVPALASDRRFASNGLRVANRNDLDAAIAEALKPLDRAELIRRLAGAAIAYGSLNSVDDLSVHPALRRVVAMAPGGELTLPASPLRWNGETQAELASPALGADTSRLREEFE